MFNLLISFNPETWASDSYEFDKSRVAIEYTADEISERYKSLDDNAIEELKSFPTLFVTEQEQTESRIGRITNIRVRSSTVFIEFQFDPVLPALPRGSIESIRTQIDLGKYELYRTHWAIKDEPIFDILLKKGLITQQQLDASQNLAASDHLDPGRNTERY